MMALSLHELLGPTLLTISVVHDNAVRPRHSLSEVYAKSVPVLYQLRRSRSTRSPPKSRWGTTHDAPKNSVETSPGRRRVSADTYNKVPSKPCRRRSMEMPQSDASSGERTGAAAPIQPSRRRSIEMAQAPIRTNTTCTARTLFKQGRRGSIEMCGVPTSPPIKPCRRRSVEMVVSTAAATNGGLGVGNGVNACSAPIMPSRRQSSDRLPTKDKEFFKSVEEEQQRASILLSVTY